MVQYKLHYFPVRGRGEFIRYIFAQANVPYEEVLIPFAGGLEEWKNKLKPTYQFGVVPTLDVDGKTLSQSLAIGRFLADRYDLAGSDEWRKAEADMLVHFIEDIYSKGYRDLVVSHLQNNVEGKVKAWEALRDIIVKGLYEKFENTLGNKTWFCGDKVTWADLYIAEFSDRIERCFDKNFVSQYQNLHRHMKRVHELPNIKKYIEKRSPSIANAV